MATAQTIITKARYELKDLSPIYQQYSDAEMIVYINDAVRSVMRRVVVVWPEFWEKTGQTSVSTPANIVAGTQDYPLPTGLFHLIDVIVADSLGSTTVLDPISYERTLDAAANGYLLLAGNARLRPIPTVNVTGGLTFVYVATPTEVAVVGDAVPLSDIFEDAVKEFVVLKCKGRQGDDPSVFATFYREVRDALDTVITRTNDENADQMHVQWRSFV
jgi:hypothetical protein